MNPFNFKFEKRFPDGVLEEHKGKIFRLHDNEKYILDSWNDLNIPYFKKINRKTLYTIQELELTLELMIRESSA